MILSIAPHASDALTRPLEITPDLEVVPSGSAVTIGQYGVVYVAATSAPDEPGRSLAVGLQWGLANVAIEELPPACPVSGAPRMFRVEVMPAASTVPPLVVLEVSWGVQRDLIGLKVAPEPFVAPVLQEWSATFDRDRGEPGGIGHVQVPPHRAYLLEVLGPDRRVTASAYGLSNELGVLSIAGIACRLDNADDLRVTLLTVDGRTSIRRVDTVDDDLCGTVPHVRQEWRGEPRWLVEDGFHDDRFALATLSLLVVAISVVVRHRTRRLPPAASKRRGSGLLAWAAGLQVLAWAYDLARLLEQWRLPVLHTIKGGALSGAWSSAASLFLFIAAVLVRLDASAGTAQRRLLSVARYLVTAATVVGAGTMCAIYLAADEPARSLASIATAHLVLSVAALAAVVWLCAWDLRAPPRRAAPDTDRAGELHWPTVSAGLRRFGVWTQVRLGAAVLAAVVGMTDDDGAISWPVIGLLCLFAGGVAVSGLWSTRRLGAASWGRALVAVALLGASLVVEARLLFGCLSETGSFDLTPHAGIATGAAVLSIVGYLVVLGLVGDVAERLGRDRQARRLSSFYLPISIVLGAATWAIVLAAREGWWLNDRERLAMVVIVAFAAVAVVLSRLARIASELARSDRAPDAPTAVAISATHRRDEGRTDGSPA